MIASIHLLSNSQQRNKSPPCGQPSTPRGRVELAATSSMHLFCARLMPHLHSVTPNLSPLFPVRRVMNDTNGDESKAAHEFAYFNGAFITRPPPRFLRSLRTRKWFYEDDNHTNTCLATAIFTPLFEYKLRQTLVTPYLVSTFYSDLASSHDLVLMCGEFIRLLPRNQLRETTY